MEASSLLALGDDEHALAMYARSLELSRALHDNMRASSALNGMGEVHRGEGRLDEAEPLYREAARLSRAAGDRRGAATCQTNVAAVLIGRGNLQEARAALAEARMLANVAGYKGLVECATDVAATLASACGEHALAARLHGAAQRQLHEARMAHDPVDEACVVRRMVASRAALGDAAFEAAKADGWSLTYGASMAELDRWLGVDASAP